MMTRLSFSLLQLKRVQQIIRCSAGHAGENRRQKFCKFPGFRVALAIAILPGMTVKFWLRNSLRTLTPAHEQRFVLSRIVRQFFRKLNTARRDSEIHRVSFGFQSWFR